MDRRRPSLRWGAVFAGTAFSIGLWMLLQLLGVGIGLATIDVDNAGSLRGAGAGTTLWSLISPLIAMFIGGMLAGRLAQTYDRSLAGMHSVVMWALTSVIGLWATLWIITMIASGAARGAVIMHRVDMMEGPMMEGPIMMGPDHGPAHQDDHMMGPGEQAGDMMAPGEQEDMMSGGSTTSPGAEQAQPPRRHGPPRSLRALGIDPQQVLAPINRKLSAEGKPQLTASDLEAALRGVVRGGPARGTFDRELLIDQLVQNNQLSRADATDVARWTEAQWTTSHVRRGGPGPRPDRMALSAADAIGKALATVGLSLLLSLVTSVLGAMLAVRRMRKGEGGGGRRAVERVTETGYPPPPVEPANTVGPAPIIPPTPVIPPTDIR